MKRHLIIASAILVAALLGCKESDMMTRVPIFKVLGPDETEQSEISLDGKARYVSFKVLASDMWTAQVTGSSAFTLPVSSGGSGSTNVQLKVEANESDGVRTATLEFCLNDMKKVFNITQEKQLPYLEVQPMEYQVSSEGEEFTITVDTNQESWNFRSDDDITWLNVVARNDNQIVLSAGENTSKARSADLVFYTDANPDLIAICSISQNKVADPPVADMLDIVFNADRTAVDKSSMGMTVDCTRLDENVSVKMIDKFGIYAACFNNETIARSGLDKGYYRIPYTVGDKFATALENGYTYEVVFSPYYNPADNTKQVKMFSATQAGGTGMCFRANTGEINFETHIGGSWKELYSGIFPQKGTYYHCIGVYDKQNEIVTLYVDGQRVASVSASGSFKHMDTSVNERWFGIGADPSGSDKGEASYYGEVVIARMYSRPISYDEVRALYKQVR